MGELAQEEELNKAIGISDLALNTAIQWRERLHQHPELGFAEHQTAADVAENLQSLGWRVTTGLAGTGVLAVLPATEPGPRLLLRAELDALPIQEETGVSFASVIPGVSHACGHDAHMAILLGVAAALAEREQPHGELGLLFQPAEELQGGGKRLVEEGLWARFDADCCLALHGWPALPAGVFGLVPGPCLAAIDSCRIRVMGRPGHGAAPHETIDPIVVAAELILALQTIISRNLNPLAPAVLTFGRINGGKAENAVAAEVSLTGTMRYFDPAVGAMLADMIEKRGAGIAAAHGARIEASIEPGYPATVNHAGVIHWLEEVVQAEFGPDGSQAMQPVMVSEDFSYYLRERPGAMIFLGTGGSYPLHHPRYLMPDNLLDRGIRLWLAVISAVTRAATLPWR
ncbi:MAG: M20 metallopeptidase family protein [Bacteroidota bacterium]